MYPHKKPQNEKELTPAKNLKKKELNPKISYKIPLLQFISCFTTQIMLTFTSCYNIVYCCLKFNTQDEKSTKADQKSTREKNTEKRETSPKENPG